MSGLLIEISRVSAPLLSTLSDSLFTRQRIRVGAEENVGDTTGDLLERISVVTSPVMRSNSRRPIRGGAIATGASLATLGSSGKDVKSPLALIVVPTRELGVQTAMLLYELVGGSLKKDPTEIRGKANSFKFKGPKGVRIGCVLDDEEAEFSPDEGEEEVFSFGLGQPSRFPWVGVPNHFSLGADGFDVLG